MIKVRMLKATLVNPKGSIVDIADHIAKLWIDRGIAELAEPTKTNKKAKDQANKSLTDNKDIETK